MPPDLPTLLTRRTWRELRVIAYAHGLAFNSNHTKCRARARLARALLREGRLRRSFRALPLAERAALVALQAAGGKLPLYEFVAVFGPIRPYRPWRAGSPRHPWRRPVSPAERLWFLGFVQIERVRHGQPATVTAPAEVLALLPPLPRPRARRHHLPRAGMTPDTVRVGVAVLLAALLREPVKPRWRRWLPPRVVRWINDRLAAPEDLADLRSELRAGRVRFLHYLAEVAGLVRVQEGVLLPTVTAWAWLDAPPAVQWQMLRDGWDRDMAAREPLWTTYRLPSVPARLWTALAAQLRALVADRTYTIASLVEALRPHVPGDEAALGGVADLLRGPLTWAGLVVVQDACFTVPAAGMAALCQDETAFSAPGDATISSAGDAVGVELPVVPPLRPLVELLSWATVDAAGVWIDAEAIRRAAGQGYGAVEVAGVLAALSGGPLAPAIWARIEDWARKAGRLVLRQMTVLTSPDADALARIRADRHLRPLTAEPLSAHHLAVQPHAVGQLRQRLARRGQPVTVESAPSGAPVASGVLTPEMAAYLWLAVHVYRRLGAWIPLPVRVPGAVLAWLAGHLPTGQADALAQTAETALDALATTIAGRPSMPAPVTQDDPAGIRAAVEAAYEERSALTVDYFSPARGAVVRRTIEPLLPLAESGGAWYIEAWCQTAGAARTFRLDRILRVVRG